MLHRQHIKIIHRMQSQRNTKHGLGGFHRLNSFQQIIQERFKNAVEIYY
jgi:hypothetical protein